MRSADYKDSRSTSGGSNLAMPSLNPGTMTFGELFVMLLNPVRVHLLLHLVLIIVIAYADIANAFGDKLQSLLNSDNSSHPLLTNIESSLSSSDLASISVSPHTVSEAVSLLKSNKSDGTSLMSNHLILVSNSLVHLLSKLFTAMLRHGYVPKSLGDYVLQPILKPAPLTQTVIGQLLSHPL